MSLVAFVIQLEAGTPCEDVETTVKSLSKGDFSFFVYAMPMSAPRILSVHYQNTQSGFFSCTDQSIVKWL